VLVATSNFEPDVLYRNLGSTPDVHAPRVLSLEQLPDRAQGPAPSVVRVHVYDNAAWYVTATYAIELQFASTSGASGSVPMQWNGGQVFRGELDGALVGLVSYRVVATDEQQNTGASAWTSFTSTCTGLVEAYCTAKTNSLGCVPAVAWQGTPSVSSAQPFWIEAHQVLNNKVGILFYGDTPDAKPFRGGIRCVDSPLRRMPVQSSGGAPSGDDCSGVFAMDFNARIQSGVDPLLAVGARIYAQHWYRDPNASHNSGLSDALAFSICP
jgi:hypothetical protein